MTAATVSLLSLEVTIVLAIAGAIFVSLLRKPLWAWTCGLAITGATLLGSLLACAAFYLGSADEPDLRYSLQQFLFGRSWLGTDELSAPLVPMLALLHFLMALATGRTKMRRFSLSLSLAAEAIGLATFGCQQPAALVALLVLGVVPPYVELASRKQPARLYLLHMGLFVLLLLAGWSLMAPGGWTVVKAGNEGTTQSAWAAVLLVAAVLIRCGSVPAHAWVSDWFSRASFGSALLFVAPLFGVHAAVRLVVPFAPDGALASIGIFSLVTAVYAACMAVVQQDTRRLFAYQFLSHASLVLVGVELHTPISFTGSLALWVSTSLSLCGLGLTMRALEARFGRLSLARFHGLYDHSPTLAICFLIMGLASAGFPGTFGFVGHEMLIDGAVGANLAVGLTVALAAAINGIAVVRAYFRLFTGTRHHSTVFLGMTLRERLAVLTLVTLILAGGLVPQPVIASRHRAAEELLRLRSATIDQPTAGDVANVQTPSTEPPPTRETPDDPEL